MTPKNAPKPAPTTPDGAQDNKPAESKADRFQRVASHRTAAALKALDNLANTANKNTYEWTPEQADKIVSALQGKVDNLKSAYAGEKSSAGGFSL